MEKSEDDDWRHSRRDKLGKLLLILVMSVLLVSGMETAAGLLYPSNDITRNWQFFYSLPRNSVDLLIVGSSHAFSSFDPEIFDGLSGKRTCILASNSQTVTQTYFNVKEALHYQKPELILLEAFGIDGNCNWQEKNGRPLGGDAFDRDWKKESNIDGMRLDLVKLEAIFEQYTPRNWPYALFKICRAHQNWKDTTQISLNFSRMRQPEQDFSCFRPSVTQMSPETIEKYSEMKSSKNKFYLCEENQKYFHKLAQLCRENGIRLFVVMAPMYDGYIEKINYESRFQAIASLAQSEQVSYLDCNKVYDEIGLEATDFEDAFNSYHHLNAQGAEKVSRYVAERIEN